MNPVLQNQNAQGSGQCLNIWYTVDRGSHMAILNREDRRENDDILFGIGDTLFSHIHRDFHPIFMVFKDELAVWAQRLIQDSVESWIP